MLLLKPASNLKVEAIKIYLIALRLMKHYRSNDYTEEITLDDESPRNDQKASYGLKPLP